VQYALLIYNDPAALANLDEDEQRAIIDEYWRIREDEAVVTGIGLHPPHVATTVRMDDGRTLVSDGPFADTREVFGGCYVVEAADIDAAIELAKRLPTLRAGGSVEIRPVAERPR
jgi:hypothetical protein